MQDVDRRWQELQAAFSAELEERARSLQQLLLELEHADHGDAAAILDALFREAHSLKGAARAVEAPQIERLAHTLESALDQARGTRSALPRAWFDAAYRAADTFVPLYRSLSLNAAPPAELAAVLAALAVDYAAAPVPAASPGQSRPSPVAHAPRNPAPPAGLPSGPTTLVAAPAETVRVSVQKLDTLLAQAGELAVTQIRIEERLRELQGLQRELEGRRRESRAARELRANVSRALATVGFANPTLIELQTLLGFDERADQRSRDTLRQVTDMAEQFRRVAAQLASVSRAIQDEVISVRLLPVAAIFGPFQRLVRDLQRDKDKQVQLLLEGGDTEIDRKILDQLRDSLMHMLRNAVDHGIELPADRAAHGKPALGTIRLHAAQRGGTIELTLEDDGAGLDPARLRRSAVEKGLLTETELAALDDQAVFDLIFLPGFSTSAAVTETSGRGVGMDVVRTAVEQLNGRVKVSTVAGQGTRFLIAVPLTLATTRAIVVEQRGQLFAIPSQMVERSARVREHQIIRVQGCRAIAIDGAPISAVELADLLEQPPARSGAPDPGATTWRSFVILRQDERRVAVLAERLVGEQEIVVKSLGWPLRRVRNVGGAAVLSSGHTVPILNPSDMLKSAFKLLGRGTSGPSVDPAPAPRERPRVLVVDDSLTTRTLERSILEAAGYQTLAAVDGAEALDILRRDPIDLVVSDVDMPRLDGFDLTAEIRRADKLRQIPVVLVTSLDAREHRERGAAVGADAYVVKGAFDQGDLLDAIGRLL